MRKTLIFLFLFLLVVSGSSYAMINTANVDRVTFTYQTPYNFATNNVAVSLTNDPIAIVGGSTAGSQILYYTVPRAGNIVGISVYGNAASTAGWATFEVVLNGTPTGIKTQINKDTATASGIPGTATSQYSYILQDRDTNYVPKGHNGKNVTGNSAFPYGKATAVAAGNRIGVNVTTSSGFAPTTSDYQVTVWVLN